MGKAVVEVAGKTASTTTVTHWSLLSSIASKRRANPAKHDAYHAPDQEPLDSMPCAAESRIPGSTYLVIDLVRSDQSSTLQKLLGVENVVCWVLASNGPRYKPFDLQTTVNVEGSAFTSFVLAKGK
ncbi:hypothetical protein I7I51_01735 [Histoplasma capsulatum]|uniref:Uncharacterized protein n=1 Tax=Ajellomyces capsulatus TaxID=5037 RepID=A0A8A1MFJ0_AJECA|nr:hypothetical protein I7I51_01735 [Histoplasma capsulatum]